MQTDKTPFFRKEVTPWYDSTPVCWGFIFLMCLLFLFFSTGITVGLGNPDFTDHIWLPLLLSISSILILIKILLRLKNRARPETDL